MARPKPLSGFPEFLPAGRIIENRVLDVVRSTFELHGFAPIETRAVEPLDQLARKGEIDKEIYVVRRLHAVRLPVDGTAEASIQHDPRQSQQLGAALVHLGIAQHNVAGGDAGAQQLRLAAVSLHRRHDQKLHR